MSRARTIVALSAFALASTAAFLFAGPLDPPAGPISPTFKTLAEVEPRTAINLINTPGDADSLFKITQPGSYYLAGNITGVVGKHGIEIAASGVTLDLNGFDLSGIPAMGDFDGVNVTTSDFGNMAVINGAVRGWGGSGVEVSAVFFGDCRIVNVRASGNASAGIFTGGHAVISDCMANQNGLIGISASGGGVINDCSADSNGNDGIRASGACTMLNCRAFDNAGDGFEAGNSSTITNCNANANRSSGFNVGGATSVLDCTAFGNTLDGIVCGLGCVIRGNLCMTNGAGAAAGAGIHVIGSRCRIEGNHCNTNDTGVDVDVAGNILIRNTCQGNTTNWTVVINNKCLVVLGINSAAINGDSGGVSPGSVDPNANFTY